ncbi:hypothetical protein N7474_004110 [Penicillium riverlandense]|uniref:uncharacterized protein n=1 Tax=Penicillium riverlandense TaxID=1903569 RepID=UPI0025490B3F|nr:uncharacterized protein N7474_004110 [Penicillium riverlandense]KAJ5818519.1 hypothetical protein N7474_004110 [Penicillium riverlandense]
MPADEHQDAVSAPPEPQSAPAPTTEPVVVAPEQPKQKAEDEDDSDFDELDDVLDDFSKPKAQPPPPAAAAAPASATETGATPADFDEDAFLKQLEKDMANMMTQAGPQSGAPDDQGFQAAVDQGADAFAKQLEESGIPPGDFLKQLLADVMAEEGSGDNAALNALNLNPAAFGSASTSSPPPAPSKASAASAAADSAKDQPADSFSDAIQRTVNRMKESGDRATAAASNEDELSDDMLAQLLKAMEAGASGSGEDGDLTKMFMGMMEQLSNKEMLYEPMKELDDKFGPWIEKNKAEGTSTVTAEEMERYETQARIVKQIVQKFEEEGYTDEDSKCREYVWERMQEMQAAGNPPEELISNPFMGDPTAAGAAGAGIPDCPQQ